MAETTQPDAARTAPTARGADGTGTPSETFTQPVPLASTLADAALARAADLGCSHADVRVERIREAFRSYRDADLSTSQDSEVLGLSVRVLHEGVWGFAAGITLTTDCGGPAGRSGRGHRHGLPAADAGPDRAGRRAGLRRRDLGLGVRAEPLRRARGGPARPDARADRPAARRRCGQPHHRRSGVRPGEQVLREPRRHVDHPAAGPDPAPASRADQRRRSTGSPPCAPSPRRPAGAGST